MKNYIFIAIFTASDKPGALLRVLAGAQTRSY